MARTRENQVNLSSSKWDKFINSVKEIKKSGADKPLYKDFVGAHQMSQHKMTAHRFPEFLPWHREFLFQFENRLREIEPDVTIPYWDWTRNRTIPSRLSVPSEWGVKRDLQPTDPLPGFLGALIARAQRQRNFVLFHNIISGPHGTVHVDIGGEMGDIQNSPSDVLFWLHHCYLDKVWADWQKSNRRQNPDIPSRLIPISVFKHTGNEVMSITDLGYKYK